MKLLLDSHVLIGLIEESLRPGFRDALADPQYELHASVASLWEIAIKVRLGKLPLKSPIDRWPELIADTGMVLLGIEASHVLADVTPAPATRDPFDRLLLAQCAIERMQLVTLDRILAGHPLAMRV